MSIRDRLLKELREYTRVSKLNTRGTRTSFGFRLSAIKHRDKYFLAKEVRIAKYEWKLAEDHPLEIPERLAKDLVFWRYRAIGKIGKRDVFKYRMSYMIYQWGEWIDECTPEF